MNYHSTFGGDIVKEIEIKNLPTSLLKFFKKHYPILLNFGHVAFHINLQSGAQAKLRRQWCFQAGAWERVF